jgi:hypothetical protein
VPPTGIEVQQTDSVALLEETLWPTGSVVRETSLGGKAVVSVVPHVPVAWAIAVALEALGGSVIVAELVIVVALVIVAASVTAVVSVANASATAAWATAHLVAELLEVSAEAVRAAVPAEAHRA